MKDWVGPCRAGEPLTTSHLSNWGTLRRLWTRGRRTLFLVLSPVSAIHMALSEFVVDPKTWFHPSVKWGDHSCLLYPQGCGEH